MPALTTVVLRRGTAVEWSAANPVLLAGEPGYETDTGVFGIGDGSTAWNSLTTKVTLGGTFTPSALTKTDDTNVTLTLGGSPSTALINAASLTLGWTGQLGLTRGGTAANLTAINGGVVYSTGSALAISAAGTTGKVLTSAGAAAPTWETPASVTPAALTRTDDTNVTLTLGGTPTTALLQATSITAGWTGVLAGSRGGTGYAGLKPAGVIYGLSTSYISGAGTAGTDATAMTVKTIAVAGNTLTQVGDRLCLRVFWRGDTAGSPIQCDVKVNSVTVMTQTSGTGNLTSQMEIWLSYIDATHANVIGFSSNSGGTVQHNLTTSVANVASFDWANSQNIDVTQTSVASNHVVVYEIVGTIYPLGVALA